jgi:hypothetical protein
MNFVSNIIWNSVEGFVEAGTRTAGGYAGDALLKAGDLIEGGGRSVGKGMFVRFVFFHPFPLGVLLFSPP